MYVKGWLCLIFSMVLYATDVSACTLTTGYKPFELAVDARPGDAPDDTLRTPEVETISITRGVGGAPGTCAGSGILVLDLKWPRGDYKIDEIGFEFRVVSMDSAYAVFPAEPIAIITEKRRSEVLFLWPDDPPTQQKPLRMEVEVRAVTRDYLRGPPMRFTIDSSQED